MNLSLRLSNRAQGRLMINDTLDRLMSDEQRAHDERVERQQRQNSFILRVVLVLLAAIWIIAIASDILGSYIRIDNVEVIGTSALCPGDNLVYRYDYRAKANGAGVIDATVWRISPPQTVVFSTRRYFVLIGERSESVVEYWPVPRTYIDLASGQALPIPPGDYERQFSVASDNDDEVGDTDVVPFSIRKDCEG